MTRRHRTLPCAQTKPAPPGYDAVYAELVDLLESARRAAARSVNAVMAATHWEIGRRVIEFEQGGSERAGYGEGMLKRLSEDLGRRFGRGFSLTNLKQFRKFFLLYRDTEKGQTDSDQFGRLSYSRKGQTVSDLLKPGLPINATPIGVQVLARQFPLPWSHYVQLLKVDKHVARAFYEAEALRNGWTVRQLGNRPVGVILCTQKDSAIVHYALETLPNKVLATEYRTTLPEEETLAAELERTRRSLESLITKSAKRQG